MIGHQVKKVGITNPELPFHSILVPLPILLLDVLVSLECLDKFAVYQRDLPSCSCFSDVITNQSA